MLQFQVIGNLGADAEVVNHNGSKFVSFNVAHTDRWTDENGNERSATQWVSCAYSGHYESILPFLKKGKQVYVSGRGSVRVYSSPKERRMVAGCNIAVERIELLGGQVDAVPRTLYDDGGEMHNVNKAYFVEINEVKAWRKQFGNEAAMMAQDGRRYIIDKNGFVMAQPEAAEEIEPNQQ